MSSEQFEPGEGDRTRLWLASMVMRRGDTVLVRFARVRAALAQRPRRWRRQFRRRLAVTMTGAALLMALAGMGVGAQMAARAEPANVITVVNGEVNKAANGKCSLVEAIQNANNRGSGQPNTDCAAGNPSGADIIVLPQGGAFSVNKYDNNYYYGYTALPVIDSKITVEGNGSTITRTGKKDMRFFTAATIENNVADLTLNNLTLTNGRNYYYNGGAVYAYGATLTINNCTITGNEAGGNGGGIFTTYTDLTITNSTISNNESYGGGGIYAGYGKITIVNSTLSGNEVIDNVGGGAYMTNGEIVLDGVTVSNNKAYSGAGMMFNYSNILVTGSVFSGNETGTMGDGGGLYLFDATGSITNTAISGNSAYQGGGAFVYDGVVTFRGSTLSGNEANSGGGLYNWTGSELLVVNSTFSGNQATGKGGGAGGIGTMTFVNATFSGNTAGVGGGGLHVMNGTTTLHRTLLSGNSAPGQGFELERQAGTVNINSHNLFGFNNNSGLGGVFVGATDVIPGLGTTVAMVLGPLADNTGLTKTHALPLGSPALDKGPSAACSAALVGGMDQRGQPRNTDANGVASANECDIGAYELIPAGPIDTPTPTATPLISPTPTATATIGPSPTPTVTGTVTPGGERVLMPVVIKK